MTMFSMKGPEPNDITARSAEPKPYFRPYNQSVTIRRGYVWFLGLIAAMLCRIAAAQTPVPPATPDSTPVGEVKVETRQFGVGSHVRHGELFGVQLVLTDSADKPRKVVVSMGLPDDDGDVVLASRSVTLNPRLPMEIWLYGRMPSPSRTPPAFQVSIREAGDSEDFLAQAIGGRQIAAARVRPITQIDPDEAMFGVVGRRDLGLDAYELRDPGGGLKAIAHEVTRIVRGLDQSMLPDDWRGLSMFDTIVWTEGDPLRLEGNRPQAIREWVNRGGHLVIVLPAVGNSWWDDANPLRDVMPEVEVDRIEDADIRPYRNMLTTPDTDAKLLPTKTTILHTLNPRADAATSDAISVLAGPDGTVVARRLVGTGMVTVVGLNLAEEQLSRAQLVRVEAFWHRVLGGRFADPPEDKNKPTTNYLGGGVYYSDDQIGASISKSAAAGVGVLLALVVFGVYWLVVGPGGWGLLRARNATRHAWVAFALTTGVFTAIAWAGATWIKPKNVRAYHFTILDHVYAQPVQRMRTWAGILLPGYGETTLRVGERDADTTWRQPVTTWSAPPGDAGAQSFPDARAYAVDVQRPETITLPMRATIKETQIDFLGGPRWKGLRPTAQGQEPKLLRRGKVTELTGTLTHEYPGALSEVWFIAVTGQMGEIAWQEQWEKKNFSPVLAKVHGWKVTGTWEPGTERSITQELTDTNVFDARLRDLVPTSGIGSAVLSSGGPDVAQAPNDYLRLSLLNMLAPPLYEESRTFGSAKQAVKRRATHGFDLSRWFTQPCVIVLGIVDDAPMPTPLYVLDGDTERPVASEGRTLVRWVYPLTPEAPIFTGRMLEKPKAAPKTTQESETTDEDEAGFRKPTGGP